LLTLRGFRLRLRREIGCTENFFQVNCGNAQRKLAPIV
jgi:hypothetical protein